MKKMLPSGSSYVAMTVIGKTKIEFDNIALYYIQVAVPETNGAGYVAQKVPCDSEVVRYLPDDIGSYPLNITAQVRFEKAQGKLTPHVELVSEIFN
ncbi:hypothetical protein [Bacterioplanoides sp.]|uniref:hypothetical protein n=1 Tax=Bacterioplanoides sp. TaxID=2066072 RepID=UPI003B58FA6A